MTPDTVLCDSVNSENVSVGRVDLFLINTPLLQIQNEIQVIVLFATRDL